MYKEELRRVTSKRSNVQRAVGRSQVANGDQHHVHHRPHAQAAEAEQLTDALL